jgi:CheY-like chemotaxis protein/anti-sigma regulatory factor (Ser/Thr protein kinase)
MGSLNEEHPTVSADVQAIRETAASVAHGLNNLLGSVAGLAAQLVALADPADPVDELRLIQQATQDSLALTRRLLHLSRGESGPALDGWEPIDMGRVLADVVELTRLVWQERAREQGIAIELAVEVDHAVGRPLLVRGVASELREIVGNLVHNAVDAMPAGGRLWLRGALEDGSVLVACQDSGMGMPPDVLRRVFEPFFTTKGERGTGLGLEIVRRVVARHGGEVQVTSEVGVGTTVTLRLPAAEAPPTSPPRLSSNRTASDRNRYHALAAAAMTGPLAAPSDGAETGASGVHAHHAVAWEKPSMSLCVTARASAAEEVAATLAMLSVLVVEDDPIFRRVFTRRLALDARHVDAVGDAASALAALELRRWDVLCVDDGLPDRPGRELAAEIRRRGLPCAVVLVTGTAAAPGDPNLAAPGVDAILPKPCTDAELARALRLARAGQLERAGSSV